ncbi:hypothetical protein GNP80_03800 [Aliivibrio fischeri]|uniref:baseplate J/gp47 family protein n=1 Tax=Aliivibrio fischeri TaxID=668 RepID=UPI0012D93551|nr:baseplate J/gp47 family protein [Aliivibrio fischeri]MUK91575.1 hypothetical protein [Aliivibrio fischeri]
MPDIPKPDYAELVKQSGIPTDEASWKKVLKEEMDKEGCEINNDSRFSPFWRLIEQAVIVATVWLIENLLIKYVLPNTFLATAFGDSLKLKAWEVSIEPKSKTKAKGKIVFQRTALKGPALVISKDTWVQTEPINGTIYRVKVLEDTTMPEDKTTITATVEAEHEGAAYNLGGGYFHVLPVAISGIAAATNEDEWLIEAGSDDEDEDELRLRIRNQWSAVAKWHIDAAYRSLLMTKAGIQDDNVYFEHNAPRGAGTANALILLDTGNPSQELIDELNHEITVSGLHGHGDDLLVKAMPETDYDISVIVWPQPALIDGERAQLKSDIENIVRAAFRENSDYNVTRTNPQDRFSFSRLEGELHTLLVGIKSLKFEQDDIISNLTIPRLSSLTVKMQE